MPAVREICFSLFLVLVFAAGHKANLLLKGADQTVFASEGEDVILNCSVDSHQAVHEVEEVTWRKKVGNILVLLFQDNEIFPDSSHESYQGRAEFFITEIPKGNFSLKLKDVTAADDGEFICEIHTRHVSARTVVVLHSVDPLILKGADQTIVASAGDEVILNCSVDSHQPVHEIEEVTWKKKDGDLLILLFQNNQTFSDSSHESYQGRAEFFITEIPKGNFSLKLKDVRLEDKGEFICEIHTGDMSGRTIVDLQSVGLSMCHISTLLLCIAALLFTVGKITCRMDLMIQVTLMICSNMCLCVAFILWLKEGFLSEVVICSVVCFARPIMLMSTSPYLNTGCCQKALRNVGLLVQHSIIVIAAISTLVYNTDRGLTVVIMVILFSPFFLDICLPFPGLKHFMISTTLNRLMIFIMIISEGDFESLIQMISVFSPLFLALTTVLSLQSYYIHGKLLKGFQSALSAMLFLYTNVNIGAYVFITSYTGDFSKGWILLFEAVIFIIVGLAVNSLLRSCRTAFRCLQQRWRGYLCSTVTVFILTIVYGEVCLYFPAKLLENRKDGAGYLPLTLLVNILATTAMFNHPEHVPRLLHIVIYMFGAVGLTVINSVALASELILKAVKGARTIEDLRLIVLPFETLFVVIWLVLQISETWLRIKDRLNQGRRND